VYSVVVRRAAGRTVSASAWPGSGIAAVEHHRAGAPRDRGGATLPV